MRGTSINGTVSFTIPQASGRKRSQEEFNNSNIEMKDRMNDSVAPKIIDELLYKLDDFKKAYLPEGMGEKDFDSYGKFVTNYFKKVPQMRHFFCSLKL